MTSGKKTKRFSTHLPSKGTLPQGEYRNGIGNTEFADAFGRMATYWTHVEEEMIEFLAVLMGAKGDGPKSRLVPARQIFRAISSQNARVKVMKTLLERTQINSDKSEEYDAILTEFGALNDLRNIYVHGLWHTHAITGRAFISESMLDDGPGFHRMREVPIEELKNAHIRMMNLQNRVILLEHPEYAPHFHMRPLLEIPPPPPL